MVARWKATVLEQLHRLFDEESLPNPEQTRIADLEQLVGRQALELEILKKAIADAVWSVLSSKNGRSS